MITVLGEKVTLDELEKNRSSTPGKSGQPLEATTPP